jgi:hypothetical protein
MKPPSRWPAAAAAAVAAGRRLISSSSRGVAIFPHSSLLLQQRTFIIKTFSSTRKKVIKEAERKREREREKIKLRDSSRTESKFPLQITDAADQNIPVTENSGITFLLLL